MMIGRNLRWHLDLSSKNLMGTIDSGWGASDCLIGGHFHCPLHQQNSTKTRA